MSNFSRTNTRGCLSHTNSCTGRLTHTATAHGRGFSGRGLTDECRGKERGGREDGGPAGEEEAQLEVKQMEKGRKRELEHQSGQGAFSSSASWSESERPLLKNIFQTSFPEFLISMFLLCCSGDSRQLADISLADRSANLRVVPDPAQVLISHRK